MRRTGPTCKYCRRYNTKLCGKGAGKCAWERRRGGTGRMARRPGARMSQYGLQLAEKQKAKFIYGVSERQFRNYYDEAARRQGITGDVLMLLLEGRLDNVVYRLGFSITRKQARQAVNHGHFQVNDKKVDIPTYQISAGDRISWREKSQKGTLFEVVQEQMRGVEVPVWLKREGDGKQGEVIAMPTGRPEDIDVDTRMIVEYYSRR